MIEEHNPHVEFDWTRILKGEAPDRRPKERPQEHEDAAESSTTAKAAATVAEEKLGPEGLARLRARHAEVLARISDGIQDAARRDELKSRAERLNPDTWVTEEEVAAGLEKYEAEFEALRTAVTRRRKRRRSRRGRHAQSAPMADTASTDEPDGDETPESDDS